MEVEECISSIRSHVLIDSPPRKSKENSASRKDDLRFIRKCAAEAFGTYVMMCFGLGVVAQNVFSDSKAGSSLSIHVGWALGVYFGILIAKVGGSEGHLNPAVSLARGIYNSGSSKFRRQDILPYVMSQFLGAFLATATMYLNYSWAVDPTFSEAAAGVWMTFPASQEISTFHAMWNEFLGSAFLLLGIFALTEAEARLNHDFPPAPAIASLVFVIGLSLGLNTGYAINPARDWGPRVFMAVAEYGLEVFTARAYYCWVPLIIPLFGGIVGAGVYTILEVKPRLDHSIQH